jgi:peroxiredoxin Q/BCP
MSYLARLLALSSTSLALCSLTACSRDSSPPQPTSASSGAVTAATAPSPSGEVSVGNAPPDFAVKDQDGAELKLSALKGKPVVLYFYPRDETPGCTREACAFRDSWKELEKKGVVLIGVSTDSVASHQQFARHHQLPFRLVSDEGGTLARAFGVPNSGGFLGRQTFVIGADGKVKKIYREVDVTRHAAEVLADLGA